MRKQMFYIATAVYTIAAVVFLSYHRACRTFGFACPRGYSHSFVPSGVTNLAELRRWRWQPRPSEMCLAVWEHYCHKLEVSP